MAGLYIHIPFCRDACTYCDFHFSISTGMLDRMLKAIRKELIGRRDYLEGAPVGTIYLGGGTPSILTASQLHELFKTIRENYRVEKDAEVTLEGNPDDLNLSYLHSLKETGINRLSIGIQSFREGDLKLLNRKHTPEQSRACLEHARKAGFDNLNLDLIYGLPGMKTSHWKKNLETALEYRPAHLAAYHLSYEQGTVMDFRRRKNQILPVDENISLEQYKHLTERMSESGYQHYEISNFALPGSISRHNSGYWSGEKYLGAGPSAHSFNGRSRRWNMPKNYSYVKGVEAGTKIYEEETLDDAMRFHEYLMTSLRTVRGIDTEFIAREWGQQYSRHVRERAMAYVKTGKLSVENGKMVLTREGMFIADHIIRELFL